MQIKGVDVKHIVLLFIVCKIFYSVSR